MAVFVALGLMLGLSGTATATTEGVTEYTTGELIFWGPSDTHAFLVEKVQGAGRLTVDSMDCCISGDQWRVDIVPIRPAAAKKGATGIGTGSIFSFSGAAMSRPVVAACVLVSYHEGVDVWPAGMSLRFQYDKQPGMKVTPVGTSCP